MTKAQIHFSNHLEELTEVLKENLFPEGSGAFDKRLIVVPHLKLKDDLLQTFAKDPSLQVAAGLQITNLSEAWAKITKRPLPSTLELSLFLQHALMPMIEEEEELTKYFMVASRKKRIGPFCDALAQYFLRYALYGKKPLSNWQEKLWGKVVERWLFPIHETDVRSKWKIHLFGFSFLPNSYFSFFQRLDAQVYLFSPCEIFWADFYSEKEQSLLAKEVPKAQLDLFRESFKEQHPLLASWGRVGRKMLILSEESNLPAQEHYIEVDEKQSLHKLQIDFLNGGFVKHPMDESMHCASAATALREVEILKDQLLKLFETERVAPWDVQVFAPDIGIYAPYIHAVFSDFAYTISDLEFQEVDPVAKAFKILIELPQKRFSLENVLQLFNTSAFKEKFPLNTALVRKWLTLANVRWGFSSQQRKTLYLQDAEEQQIVENPEEGTWEKGLKRLLLGLGQIEGEEMPLCAIAVTEMEMFNQLYTLMHSLVDDLSPLYDQTLWTIPTWMRYFGCLLESYFAIDPTHDLYKSLQQLAANTDRLDEEEVSFAEVERVLLQLLGKKGKTHQAAHLQAIRFSALTEGAVLPGKVICLMGMQEEAFPRREERASLYAGEKDFRPQKNEQDRYLFLQALLSAREKFFISYVRDASGQWGSSSLVQELLSHLEDGEVDHHPANPFDPEYFLGQGRFSYSREQFAIAQAKIAPNFKEPLLADFYETIEFISPPPQEEVSVQKICKFARHPLRYYLHEILGIYPEWSKKPEQAEHVLDALTKYSLVREAISTPLDEVLEHAKKRGELPLNLLAPLAKKQITKEVEQWHLAMESFGIHPNEVSSKQLKVQCGNTRLVGHLDLWTPKGLLVWGKDCLEDRIRFWPQALLMKQMGLGVFLVKDQKCLEVEGTLEDYLEYFFLASKHPSPLLPAFAKSLLEKDAMALSKDLKQAQDEVWSWLLFRDPMPKAEAIHQNWSGYLRALFGRANAAV